MGSAIATTPHVYYLLIMSTPTLHDLDRRLSIVETTLERLEISVMNGLDKIDRQLAGGDGLPGVLQRVAALENKWSWAAGAWAGSNLLLGVFIYLLEKKII